MYSETLVWNNSLHMKRLMFHYEKCITSLWKCQQFSWMTILVISTFIILSVRRSKFPKVISKMSDSVERGAWNVGIYGPMINIYKACQSSKDYTVKWVWAQQMILICTYVGSFVFTYSALLVHKLSNQISWKPDRLHDLFSDAQSCTVYYCFNVLLLLLYVALLPLVHFIVQYMIN